MLKFKREKSVFETIKDPFQRFFRTEASSGILLIVFTLIALVWANSPWGNIYTSLWAKKLTIGFGEFNISETLGHWINDGLMAIFFFVVGLEIKREIVAGELSSLKQASLPIAAAIGGMLVPALIFVFLVGDGNGSEGWGVPMATDIAFSLGILSLLGKRVPLSLKIFLTAFAIVDDLGAVLIIAIFYNSGIVLNALFIAGALVFVLLLLNYFRLNAISLYILIGFILWYFFLVSGVHPTLAGVILAFLIPQHRKVMGDEFVLYMRENLDEFKKDCNGAIYLSNKQMVAIDKMEMLTKKVQSPVQELEHSLHGFVSYFVMPVFALANAGIILTSGDTGILNSLSYSILLALVLGNLIGISLASWIVIKTGLASLPKNVKWINLIGIAMLGGMGFTMSLFISNLAFSDPELLNQAKIGILIGSLIAGVSGYLILRFTLSKDHS